MSILPSLPGYPDTQWLLAYSLAKVTRFQQCIANPQNLLVEILKNQL